MNQCSCLNAYVPVVVVVVARESVVHDDDDDSFNHAACKNMHYNLNVRRLQFCFSQLRTIGLVFLQN